MAVIANTASSCPGAASLTTRRTAPVQILEMADKDQNTIDNRTVSLILPYPPSANRYWRTFASNGRAVTYVSEEAKAYKKIVADIAGVTSLIQSEVVLRIRAFRPQRSGDLSNRIKVLEDALKGVVIVDDKQVVEIHAHRFEDKFRPRVEVEVEALGLC